MTKEEKLIEVLNDMVKYSTPVAYESLNRFLRSTDDTALKAAEQKNPELGITCFKSKDRKGENIYHKEAIGVSTMSIIATITDVLIGKRLAVIVETDGPKIGIITGFKLVDAPKKPVKKVVKKAAPKKEAKKTTRKTTRRKSKKA